MSVFLARFWAYIAAVALIVAGWIGFQVVYAKLDAANAQRAELATKLQISNASIKDLQTNVDKQNAAILAQQEDGEKRLLEGRALILAEVRKGTATLAAASKLSANPKTGGDQSTTSPAVLALKGEL